MPDSNPVPKRGEVWRVNLDPTTGDEMQKTRPAVVISSDEVGRLNLRLVCPFTDWKPHYGAVLWLTRVDPSAGNGLTKTSAADAFQTRSVSVLRFVEKLGTLPAETMNRIAASLALTVEFSP